METAKVYFTDFHVPVGTSHLKKLYKLLDEAGLGKLDFNRQLVCIKLSFGEPGNMSFLRPNYAKVVADYVKETENHVLYRVTPIFEGDNLVAHGVLMEGWSVEDEGEGVCFCVYAYNAQPGIVIDYATGESREG